MKLNILFFEGCYVGQEFFFVTFNVKLFFNDNENFFSKIEFD